MNKEKFDKENIFGLGNPNDGFKEYFSGASFLNPLTDPSNCSLFLANVKHWHGAKKD